jgi:hypothetical protein
MKGSHQNFEDLASHGAVGAFGVITSRLITLENFTVSEE